jgi:hypothetical protein
MAFFYNPTGVPFPNPEKFNQDPDTRLIAGSAGADTFVFDHDVGPYVVAGLLGADTFNQAADIHVREFAYYGGFSAKVNWPGLHTGIPWAPDWSNDTFHIGMRNTMVKPGLSDRGAGENRIVIHGNDSKNGPIKVWVQQDHDRIYMGGDREDVFDFKTFETVREGDHWSTRMNEISVTNGQTGNPINSNQKVTMVYRDSGHLMDWSNAAHTKTHNLFEETWIDHRGTSALTEAEVQNWVTHVDDVLI